MTIDVGTGDGRAVLAAAAREPDTLALGLDASAPAMAEASRRAARPIRKGGLPNAAFIVAAAEGLPPELTSLAGLVTIRFPWGSLLRGCGGADEPVADGVASLVAAGGALELLLAPSARDGLELVPTDQAVLVAAVEATFGRRGFRLVEGRAATPAEVEASGSSWARRLSRGPVGGAPDRSVVLIRLERR